MPTPTSSAPAVGETRRREEAAEQAPSLAPERAQESIVEVHFDSGAVDLTDRARGSLDGLCRWLLSEDREFHLGIQGHSDPTGQEAANRRLSEHRARVVRTYLETEHGVPEGRMSVVPLGSAVPVADNRTAGGRQQNRRVVVVVL